MLVLNYINSTVEEVSRRKIIFPPVNVNLIEKDGKKYLPDEDKERYVFKCIIKCKDGYVVQHNPLFDGHYDYCVYKHTNILNNKVYIGLTNKKPEDRWGIGGSGYDKQYFGKVIHEEGWDNFCHEVCYEHLSLDEAIWLERQLIYDYDANSLEHGYNRTDGGEFGHIDVDLLRKPICVYSGFGDEIKLFKEFSSIKEFYESGYTSCTYDTIIKCCKSSFKDNKLQRCGDFFVCYKEYQNYFEAQLSYWLQDNMGIEQKRKKRFQKRQPKHSHMLPRQKRKSAGPGKLNV